MNTKCLEVWRLKKNGSKTAQKNKDKKRDRNKKGTFYTEVVIRIIKLQVNS